MHRIGAVNWTYEAVQRLRELWDEGLSTAEIGRRIGATKNAVVGKAHRLDLPERPSPIIRSGDPRQRPPRAPRRPRSTLPLLDSMASPAPTAPPKPFKPRITHPEAKKMEPPKAATTFLIGPRIECRWPFGDPRDKEGFHFCCEKSEPGKSYCAAHMRKAYLKRRDDGSVERDDAKEAA